MKKDDVYSARDLSEPMRCDRCSIKDERIRELELERHRLMDNLRWLKGKLERLQKDLPKQEESDE